MALKKVSSSSGKAEVKTSSASRLSEIDAEIKEKRKAVAELEGRIKSLQDEAMSIRIAPFKIGGYAMVEVPSGRQTKVQKCLLESEGMNLYARPMKGDGFLSGRRFNVTPLNNSYTDILKPVVEED